eukprot:4864081-Amphidinium_carterae.1
MQRRRLEQIVAMRPGKQKYNGSQLSCRIFCLIRVVVQETTPPYTVQSMCPTDLVEKNAEKKSEKSLGVRFWGVALGASSCVSLLCRCGGTHEDLHQYRNHVMRAA